MRTLIAAGLVVAVVGIAGPARAQIDPLEHESHLKPQMESSIKDRHGTPIMRILTRDHRNFRQTNSPNYKNNDVPYEFSTAQGRLEGVMLCPVSGHVPFGSKDRALMRANADRFAKDNVTTLLVNGQRIATVEHKGCYVARLPFKVDLKPGKNTIVMEQRNPKTGDVAYVGGFPMGRQFNITVQQQGTRNSQLGRYGLSSRLGAGAFAARRASWRSR